MGRYKDYDRGSKRGAHESEPEPRRQQYGGAPRYDRPSSSRAPEPVVAAVRWFNGEKGFGFVDVVDGSEAFIHIRQLEAAGQRAPEEGAQFKVRIGPGQKGPEVIEVVQALEGTVVAKSVETRRRPASSQAAGEIAESIGTVKLYKVDRGFGFIAQESGGNDVFVHASALARAGLSGLAEGQRVRMHIARGQKELEAKTIELID